MSKNKNTNNNINIYDVESIIDAITKVPVQSPNAYVNRLYLKSNFRVGDKDQKNIFFNSLECIKRAFSGTGTISTEFLFDYYNGELKPDVIVVVLAYKPSSLDVSKFTDSLNQNKNTIIKIAKENKEKEYEKLLTPENILDKLLAPSNINKEYKLLIPKVLEPKFDPVLQKLTYAIQKVCTPKKGPSKDIFLVNMKRYNCPEHPHYIGVMIEIESRMPHSYPLTSLDKCDKQAILRVYNAPLPATATLKTITLPSPNRKNTSKPEKPQEDKTVPEEHKTATPKKHRKRHRKKKTTTATSPTLPTIEENTPVSEKEETPQAVNSKENGDINIQPEVKPLNRRQRRAFKNATQQPEANIKPEPEHPQQHIKTAITPAKAEGKLVTPKQGPVKTLHDEVESWQKKLEQFASNAPTKKVKPFSYDALLQTTPAPGSSSEEEISSDDDDDIAALLSHTTPSNWRTKALQPQSTARGIQ